MRMQLENEVITHEMSEIKSMIINTVLQRDALKVEMETWYNEHPSEHFPSMSELVVIDSTLSKLDSFYKKLWDYNNTSI